MVEERKIPDGYKNTEAGVIPKGWAKKKIKDIAAIFNGGTPSTHCKDYWGGKINFCTPTDITSCDGKYIFQTKETITEAGLNSCSATLLPRGTLLLCSRATIGEIRISGADIATNQGFKSLVCNVLVNNEFLFYYIQILKDLFINKASGSTFLEISKKDLSDVNVLLPCIDEQQAIAEALSDIDNLVGAVEKLIDKKRKIKEGAMQELLTGKRRLPGFTSEWVVRKIGDIAQINMGQSPDSKFYNIQKKGLPLIQGNADIIERKTAIRFFTSHVTKTAEYGDIIMTVRAPVGHVAKTYFTCCIGRGVCSITYENDYMYHYLVFIEGSWGEVSTGSTFDAINKISLKDVEVKIPENREEQQAIAQVLGDMDSDIEALEKKLNKYRAIKQGMMQELLTGRIRLI